ncbi:hypothetical protein EJ05DRAFT_477929 [Pseudovirgaria hyperparasitica]|uniref:GST C-terminal domain-containing protein n=1 Tax=Pseudovirgaria hyperparasitica TaxID=470096 RepID=A0A6A6W1J7_9PEZI|nr:uncharacterized protein EJ05DRAFT_477929 [Pseudovirgaria hyperparasitica]KAF2755864.1 hypothetical protein EJ05DRAFT_477929 [Pseudovirgaria hyperparasitica]
MVAAPLALMTSPNTFQPLIADKFFTNSILSRPPGAFPERIPSQTFPAEADRYLLYIYPGCPWAQRANITHKLKGLQDVIQVVVLDSLEPGKGWCFSGEGQFGHRRCPVFGCKYLKEIYEFAAPSYDCRIMIPALLDKQTKRIVSNSSGEITRMFISAFDDLLPLARRESSKGSGGLLPAQLLAQIDDFNAFAYDSINNGAYKTGFSSCQKSYTENVTRLFDGLDRVEALLSQPGHSPYLFGSHVTEADIRLFPAIVRFDVVYHTLFKCNLKMIRYDYPRIHAWLRRLYWDESTSHAFKDTTYMQIIREGYTRAAGETIVPIGPLPDVVPLSP